MRKIAIAAGLVLALAGSQAVAEEHRGGDAALGALSGAVVFGPIGAVAGAVVGYAAGPSIAHSWGFRRSRSARHTRPPRQETRVSEAPAATSAPALAPAAAPAPQPAPRPVSSAMPPVQTLE